MRKPKNLKRIRNKKEMSRVWLTVDLDPGSHITHIATSLINIASSLDINVKAKFNGITLIARKGDSPELMIKSFLETSRNGFYPVAEASRASKP